MKELAHLESIKKWVSDMEIDPNIRWRQRYKGSDWEDLPKGTMPSWGEGVEYERSPEEINGK